MNVYGKFTIDVLVCMDIALLPEGLGEPVLHDCIDDVINAIMKYRLFSGTKYCNEGTEICIVSRKAEKFSRKTLPS